MRCDGWAGVGIVTFFCVAPPQATIAKKQSELAKRQTEADEAEAAHKELSDRIGVRVAPARSFFPCGLVLSCETFLLLPSVVAFGWLRSGCSAMLTAIMLFPSQSLQGSLLGINMAGADQKEQVRWIRSFMFDHLRFLSCWSSCCVSALGR